jgi:hypothetical protein
VSEINGSEIYYEQIITGAKGGVVVTAGSGVVTGAWGRIHFIENTKLHGISAGNLVNISALFDPVGASGPQFSAGSELRNTVTGIRLHNGTAICYTQ